MLEHDERKHPHHTGTGNILTLFGAAVKAKCRKGKTMKNINAIVSALSARSDRSAWDKGVTCYAVEMAEELAENINGGYIKPDTINDRAALLAACLNGAKDWSQYSWGGCSLIYDGDIAERLCTPSELKKTRNGERRPNSREEWLDVQARALHQAFGRIYCAAF